MSNGNGNRDWGEAAKDRNTMSDVETAPEIQADRSNMCVTAASIST